MVRELYFNKNCYFKFDIVDIKVRHLLLPLSSVLHKQQNLFTEKPNLMFDP